MKLDFFKLLENLGIGCIGFELFKIIAVIDKSVADKLGKKGWTGRANGGEQYR